MYTVADVWQTAFSYVFFLEKQFCILVKISAEFFPDGTNGNMSVLAEVMAWCLGVIN